MGGKTLATGLSPRSEKNSAKGKVVLSDGCNSLLKVHRVSGVLYAVSV